MDCGPQISQAYGLHQQGKLDAAAEIYADVLALDSRNFAALQLLGVLRSQQGRNADAKSLLEAALAIRPDDFGVQLNYGQVLAGAGRYQDAVLAFDKALATKPDFFLALYNKAIALSELQQLSEAVECFDRALRQNPRDAACFYNRGLCLAAVGRLEEACASYDAALALNPQMAIAWNNRGNVLRELGRNHDSLESYDRALALQPSHAQAWSNRGHILLTLEHFGEAVESFDKSLALRAGDGSADVEILNSRGVALWHLNRTAEAKLSYDRALALQGSHVATLLNRAQMLQGAGQLAAALADYDKAVADDPGSARAWNGRGSVLHALNRGSEALANFDKALSLDPAFADALTNRAHLRWAERGDHAGAVSDIKAALAANPRQSFARGELLHLKSFAADWFGFDEQVKAIDDAVRQGQQVVRPFVYQALSQSPADLQRCSRIFAASLSSPPAEAPPPFAYRHERIRIGYVSGEFREQATAYLMAGLYERHDRSKFEIIAIDNVGGDASPMRRRLESAFDRFLHISQMSDAEAVERIRSEEIDILVNLNGYFGAPRMGIFMRRAAPLQVNYLGFPATLGTSCMDYILADRIVIPPDEQCFYDEQVVYLPNSYQANDDKRPIADQVPSRAALGLPEQSFVFCNFNQSYKITPAMFACWMRILQAVDGSVLWLLTGRPPFEANLLKAAERHGIDPRRLILASNLSPDMHLARLKQADLFLDSLPYNAHTTASDALWAGLPLLTCRGTTFPGRVAASLLTAVGMPELITESMIEYESRAIALARDPETMSELKNRLNSNRLTYPLFATDLFRKDIEKAYIAMWETWREGEVAMRAQSFED
jgi:protein O-GlcNAc transferase